MTKLALPFTSSLLLKEFCQRFDKKMNKNSTKRNGENKLTCMHFKQCTGYLKVISQFLKRYFLWNSPTWYHRPRYFCVSSAGTTCNSPFPKKVSTRKPLVVWRRTKIRIKCFIMATRLFWSNGNVGIPFWALCYIQSWDSYIRWQFYNGHTTGHVVRCNGMRSRHCLGTLSL